MKFEGKWQCTDHNGDGCCDLMLHQLCTHGGSAPSPDCARLLWLCRSQLQRARDTSSKTIDSIKAELDMHQQALSELEDQKIKSDLERLSLKDEREKMREKLKEFKEKCAPSTLAQPVTPMQCADEPPPHTVTHRARSRRYQTLVDDKMRVQDDLINCEEEKLRVSKALIDLAARE